MSALNPREDSGPADAVPTTDTDTGLREHKGRRPRAPIMVRRRGAAKLCGVSLATRDRLDAAGKTPAAIRLGRAKLYCTAELRAWCRRGCPRRAEWAPVWDAANRRAHRA